MRKMKDHVDELFKDVPDSEQKKTIKQEILQNLEEKVYDLMNQGKEEEDAINKAIVEFGDIEEIKSELGAQKTARKGRTKGKVKLDLSFSIWGSALIIALLIFTNFYNSPHTIWFVYPTFGILWWPLWMFYRWLKLK